MVREVAAVGEAMQSLTDAGGYLINGKLKVENGKLVNNFCLYQPHQSSAQLVLDYSGEHNIPITTNPYGF